MELCWERSEWVTGRDQVGMRDGLEETKNEVEMEISRGFVSRLLAVWYQVSVEGWTGMGEERRSDRNL